MYILRIFAVSVLVPLISVGLCATGAKESGKKSHKTVFIGEDGPKPKHLENFNASSTVHFPSATGSSSVTENPPKNTTTTKLEPRKEYLPSHPHPLKIEIKSIKNSTSSFDFNPDLSEGRGIFSEWDTIVWLCNFFWKAITSYAVVVTLNLLLAPFLKKFGWGGPYWQTSINLGNEGKNDFIGVGPNLQNFKVSFGEGSNKHDLHDDKGWGWGWDQPQHGHGQGHGHQGPNGWLSYDQAAIALPYVDKYSMKAAKKSAKYAKKAQKYAMKAGKYAAKAQAYRLQANPLYHGGWLNPALGGAGGLPGVPLQYGK